MGLFGGTSSYDIGAKIGLVGADQFNRDIDAVKSKSVSSFSSMAGMLSGLLGGISFGAIIVAAVSYNETMAHVNITMGESSGAVWRPWGNN